MLFDRDEPSAYLFRLCVLDPDGGGPGGGPGSGMPGFQVLAGEGFRAGPSCGTEEDSPGPCRCSWPVEAARLAPGGLPSRGSDKFCAAIGMSTLVVDFRKLTRLNRLLCPELERSGCREAEDGGGGKLGDIGITVDAVDNRWTSRGEATKRERSVTGETRA